MRDWDPSEPVSIPPRTFLAVAFVMACFAGAGFLLLWGRL